MGTDKGLLKTQASTWAQTAVNTMTQLQMPVLLSVNTDQYPHYESVFGTAKLVNDNATIDARGPLHGILSIHMQHPAEDLFVLACDMPLMEPIILQQLLKYFETEKADAYVYTNDGAYEPLCGIYTAAALASILQLLQQGRLLKYSMKYLLDHINTCSIPVAPDQKKYFRNFNAHADLNGL